MENISVLQRTRITTDKKIKSNFNNTNRSLDEIENYPAIDKRITEGDENFLNYLNRHGLANEPNLLVLSSRNHFFYDSEDLKDVTTIINLKKLNLIKHLEDFIDTVCNVLSPETNFVGCFSDRNTQNGAGVTSRLYKRFINFLDSRIDIEIDKNYISRLLESYGFQVIDMTEIDGLTYFRTQNKQRSVA